MPDAIMIKALELANNLGGNPADVVARATAYAAFLSDNAAAAAATPAAKPATQPATKPAATAEKPATTAAKAATKPATKPDVSKTSAAAKPAAKPAAAKKPAQVGKYNLEQVRAQIRLVVNHEALGKQAAFDLLEEEAGTKNVSDLKPEQYDAVYDACAAALAATGGGGDEGGADPDEGEEFDPAA